MRRLIFLAGLALAACKGDAGRRAPVADDAAVTAPPRRIVEPAVAAPAAPRPPVPRIMREQLLEPGKVPRRELRYRLAPAPRELVATARITSRAHVGRWLDPVTLAPVREAFAFEPAATGATVHARGVVATIEQDGQPPAAVNAAEAYLTRWRTLVERRRAEITVDERGLTRQVALLGDPGAAEAEARDEWVQRWVGLAVPLPEAAIGPGARWQVVTMLRAGGAAVTQTATYQLVAVDGDRWTIEVELIRLGRPQHIAVPGLPPGATAELVALVRKVTGTITVAADNPLPLAGELAAEVRSHARFGGPAEQPRDQYSEDTATITLSSPAP